MFVDKDYLGAFVSWICLIHCLAGPLLLALGFTSVGLSFFGDERIHYLLIAPILFIAAWSIPKGLKVHHHIIPALLAVGGFSLLIFGLVFENLEQVLTVSGSLMLITAHLYNKKLLKVGYKS